MILIHKKFFQEPFISMQDKINHLPDNITQQFSLNIKTPDEMQCIACIVNNMVDHYKSTHINIKERDLQISAEEVQTNILHLMLTERHYYQHHAESDFKVNNGSLYLAQLKKLVNEKKQLYNIVNFLNAVSEYCSEYYSELQIRAIIQKQDNKDFYFKKTSLSEAIFNIFSLISRIGQFNTETSEFTISASFESNNIFPTITITAPIIYSSLQSPGWILGPSYIHSGLLSVYLLAKENDLLFHITQEKENIIFILTPMENEGILKNHNNYLNLI